MAEDKISQDAEHYRKGLLQGFGMSDTPGAGNRAKELYEAGMRKYQADPIAPIELRFERLLKQLHKPKNWNAEEYKVAKELSSEMVRCLRVVLHGRSILLQMAEQHGIKLKKGIVL